MIPHCKIILDRYSKWGQIFVCLVHFLKGKNPKGHLSIYQLY